ncbi:hypothetical protein C8J57DRAFT_1258287 [Mycena rebaudengoi]|nr:hypothetical protein C8J57DRAFT_1258287 [Mycena rebaudengoi]
MPSISLPVIRQEPKHPRPFGSSNRSSVVSYSSPHPALASSCEPKPPSTIRVFQWVWRCELLKPTPKVGHNGRIRRLGSLHSQTHFIRDRGVDGLTIHNLAGALRKLGFAQDASRNQGRRVNWTSAEDAHGSAELELEVTVTEGVLAGQEDLDENVTVKQVYQMFQKRPRPPPPGGYPYAKNDHVTTKMGKAPPSPCKVCGSKNHWDRECPNWGVYIEKQKRGVLLIVSDPSADELGMLYHNPEFLGEWEEYDPSAYEESKPDLGVNMANGLHEEDNRSNEKEEVNERRHMAYQVHMEEVEDEYWLNDVKMPKVSKRIIELEGSQDESDWEEPPEWSSSGPVCEFQKVHGLPQAGLIKCLWGCY